MNQENRELLETEISEELRSLKAIEIGSETYKTTVDGLTKLMDRSINLRKLDIDTTDKAKDRENEKSYREADINYKSEQLNIDNKYRESDIALRRGQMDNEKRDKLITNGIAIAGIVIPSIITVWGTYKTLKFEEQGTVTTIMGRGFINKLLPKK